jgi:hypothetical protein
VRPSTCRWNTPTRHRVQSPFIDCQDAVSILRHGVRSAKFWDKTPLDRDPRFDISRLLRYKPLLF